MEMLQDLTDLASGDELEKVLSTLHSIGAKCYFVGGCVRDAILDEPITDIDIEVFNIDSNMLASILARDHVVDYVGKSFGVIKIHDIAVDISVPRVEEKIGESHRSFSIVEKSDMDITRAASRRDFTMNAMYFDPLSNQVIDGFGGMKDIEAKILRHTSEKFAEDPLRVFRAMQFAARFDLAVADETVKISSELSCDSISPERILGEWKKFLLLGKTPSRGLRFLRACGWLKYFPEINNLIGCEQDPIRHPEGDVFEHICVAMDYFPRVRNGDVFGDMVVGFALLCHDFGKPASTFRDEIGIHSYHHEEYGVAPAKVFLERMRVPNQVIEQVLPLVKYHMSIRDVVKTDDLDSGIRILANRIGRLDLLLRLSLCDTFHRTKTHGANEALVQGRAKALGILSCKPRPILLGRHLIGFGLAPDKKFKELLNLAFEAQLKGKFSDEPGAISFIRDFI
ncbi:MAG: polynucleotide adenylyltransferase [Puniceicoccales bacterium]|jgi:tRNA nucleotidyltransferase (CCA-adding enzyme)|nr:polynucleotide adenylyltransferase [Puniceicoccales bacterium]